MEETVNEHYRRLLQLPEPWEVTTVEEDLIGQRVAVRLAWPAGKPANCPVCGRVAGIYDRLEERSWRHLSVMQYLLELRCAVPRCQCPEHGVKTVRLPWAEPGSRFTLHFEAFAVAVIEACRSLRQAAELLSLHWDAVQRILERAVDRGLARRSTEGLRYRGQDYVSLMTDLKGHRVLEVVAGRDTEQAVALWDSLPVEQREKIEAAAMDMGADFAAATRKAAPQAQIVHDKFHVSKLLNEAVDKVRKDEHRRLLAEGDESLKDTKFLWMQGAAVTGERALRLITSVILRTFFRLGRAEEGQPP